MAALSSLPLHAARDVMFFQRGDRWVGAAEWAAGILGAPDATKLHFERIIDQQTVGERVPDFQNFFHGFIGLQNTDRAREDAQYSSLLAIRDQPGRRRFRVETPIAGVVLMRFDRGQLPLKTKDASRDQGFFCKETGVIHQESGAEVIGPVQHQVVIRQQGHNIFGADMLLIRLHADVGIQCLQKPTAGFDLGNSHVGRGVEDLPLQVRKIDHVAVNQSDRADTRRAQVQGDRGTQASGANHKDLGPAQFLLPLAANLLEDDLPAVPFDLVFGKIHVRPLFHHVEFNRVYEHALLPQTCNRAFDFFGFA